jgi:hypothetical protein
MKDSVADLDRKTIETIINTNDGSTSGTNGQQGYGFALPLVKHLLDMAWLYNSIHFWQ